MSTTLEPSSSLYGIGEHVRPLRLDHNTYTMWNIDNPTPENQNLYGTHPFYINLMENSGRSHGVFLHNSNGMDFIYGNSNGRDFASFRSLGGILDFYVFVGESGEEVVKQYLSLVGRPHLPPYWALGFHQCRYGYKNVSQLEMVVASYKNANIPLETMWTDIDYMQNYKDFTVDPVHFPQPEMRKFIDNLHKNGQQYTLIVDPGIKIEKGYPAHDEGEKYGLWIKRPSGKDAVGKVWPDLVNFPDWFHPNSFSWWFDQNKQFHNSIPFDGMWIDMNELSNFCDGDCQDKPIPPSNPNKFVFNANFPPYKINNLANGAKNPLFAKTISPDSVHYGGVLEYDSHNLFGYMESWASKEAMEKIRGERALIISRSSYSGSGVRTGHWTGDNYSNWRNLYTSIPDILNFNLFGVPLIGADICGFGGTATEELCARWIQLGAFYPFSRNHNSYGNPPQELYVWPLVAKIGREVLNIRYNILPYYYTLFWEAHTGVGATVLNALWLEFGRDKNTFDIDKQFLVGKGILITPVLEQGAVSVRGYFPKSSVWYDYYTFKSLAPSSDGFQTLSSPLDHINIHFRGGFIIPRQNPSMVLRDARNNPFELVVPLDFNGTASGSLYLDDGKSINVGSSYSYIKFQVKGTNSTGILTSNVINSGYNGPNSLQKVNILGVVSRPSSVRYNGNPVQFVYDSGNKFVRVSLSHNLNQKLSLSWS
eukprot:TRINITY_DN29_c2_g1_i2.p1 TRINITY_DN29_c2_g1~~TRINITY_DN29_c2_g1_i2.p1  ORF type:complete len:707 (+),score=283.88 TRINITY_DN29_c2_g1_i2:811-2931(+)